MPKPTLRNILNIIAFLEEKPNDVHNGLSNECIAITLRQIHSVYVIGTSRKSDEMAHRTSAKSGANHESID